MPVARTASAEIDQPAILWSAAAEGLFKLSRFGAILRVVLTCSGALVVEVPGSIIAKSHDRAPKKCEKLGPGAFLVHVRSALHTNFF